MQSRKCNVQRESTQCLTTIVRGAQPTYEFWPRVGCAKNTCNLPHKKNNPYDLPADTNHTGSLQR